MTESAEETSALDGHQASFNPQTSLTPVGVKMR
jgi:hypothetical protein